MKRTATILLIVGAASAGTAFSRTIAAVSTPQISGEWLIDLRTVIAVGASVFGVVLPGTWWLSRVIGKFETEIKLLKVALEAVNTRLKEGDHRFETIEARIASIPCPGGTVVVKEHKHR